MTTTATDPPRTDADPGPRRAAPGPTTVVGSGRRRRQQLPWIALGVLIIVMSMLGFALWTVNQSARTPVLVAGRGIAAGETIADTDLVLVSVGADQGLTVLQAGQEDAIVGLVARGPIPAGTPLSPSLVVGPAEAVPAGQAVVGALLSPGQYPSSSIQAGDRVRLIRTAAALTVDDGDDASAAVGEAMIWAVEPIDDGRRQLFVSLLVPEEAAEAAADVAAADRLRLVLLGAG
ncbi:MAG: SAF domain-containing protein [Actinomycetota bacterium]